MTKSVKSLVLSIAAALGLALSASAQGTGMTVSPAAGSAYGLLGQNYIGATFGYVSLDDGPPDVAHKWGFIASRPSEVANLDASFKYDYTTTSAFGVESRTHESAVGATLFVPGTHVRPFGEANVGWAFSKTGGASTDSLTFLLGVGLEIQVAPRVVVSPYVNYHEFNRSNSESWNYGVKAAYRLAQDWSATGAVELDDNQNLTFKLGINRHY